MTCPERSLLVQSYVDGELAEAERVLMEQHLAICESCSAAAHWQKRFRAALRAQISKPHVPLALRERITQALEKESNSRRRTIQFVVTRALPALGAAAIFIGVFLTARDQLSPILQQALRTHHKEIPLDVVTTDCDAAARWLRGQVGFNVRPPALDSTVTCEGGRVVNVAQGFGAYFRYHDAHGKRFGVLVVDDPSGKVSAPEHRIVKGKDVYLGSENGAASAAFKGSGNVWYVVTSDDEASLQHVVEASFPSAH